MAGPHQLWVIDLLHDQAYPYAGTGEEARRDGAVNEAAFAQPSGLAIDGNTLYVADAESNTIRSVALPPDNTVTTVAGGDLFEFGDADGGGDRGALAASARRRRPRRTGRSSPILTITRSRCSIRRSGKVTTLAGTGQPGHADGSAARAQFYEPGGVVGGRRQVVYVADTNNHADPHDRSAVVDGLDADH